MKKIFVLAMALVMSIGILSVSASAEDNATLYVDEILKTTIGVKLIQDEPFVCVEDIFNYYGFDTKERSGFIGGHYVEIHKGDSCLMSYHWDLDYTSTVVYEEGEEYFRIKDEEVGRHEKEMQLIDDKHYIHYSEVSKFLGLDFVWDANVKCVGIYKNKKVPKKVVLYNKKGEPIEIEAFLQEKYIENGYKANLDEVIIIPESKKVSADGIKVSLNGGFLEFDVNPSIINGRTMVPLRVIFEALSASVDWNGETNTVVSKKNDTTISLTIDSDQMTINNQTITLDSPATIIEGRTLVPVRAVSEAFGIKVDWDEDNEIVILREPRYAEIKTVLLYNVSNQIVEVPDYDIENYTKDGWLTEKPVTMYALDGRTQIVAQVDVAANKAVGWYTTPVTMLYAPDGRSLAVPKSEVDSYKAVGWYDYPVATMYVEDGRTTIISTSEIQSYKAVGWYTASQYEVLKYKYLAGHDFRSIRNKYSHAVANGAYLYPYTDKNGDKCIMVFISYKIVSNYTAYILHNITKGTTIADAPDYYEKIADQYWGADKIRYIELATDALGAQVKAIEGYQGKIDTGLFVGAATLNL